MNLVESRKQNVIRLIESGTEVSKTGGIYRDPKSIAHSDKSQKDLVIIQEIRKRYNKLSFNY